MKKVLAIIAALLITGSVFATEYKTYAAVDYNICLGNTSVKPEGGDNQTFNTNRQGFDVDIAFYLFPVLGVYGNFAQNYLLKPDYASDLAYKFDATFGITYRHEIMKNLELNVGFGPHFSLLSLKSGSNSVNISSIGLGGTIGARYVLLKTLFLNAGFAGHYDFIPAGVTVNSGKMDIDKTTAFDAKFYIGAGIIISEFFK